MSDIDECAEGRDYCNKESEVCVNERGGYRCVPANELPASSSVAPNPLTTTTTRPSPRIPCPRGYIFSDDSRRCIGNHTLTLKQPFRILCLSLQFLSDADINECTSGVSPCRGNQQCENTVGSYVCRCAVGYRFNVATQFCEGMPNNLFLDCF